MMMMMMMDDDDNDASGGGDVDRDCVEEKANKGALSVATPASDQQ